MAPASDARVQHALAALSSDALLRFLLRQRWFGAKGAAPAEARIADAVVMPWGDGAYAIARVAVRGRDAEHTAEHVYQVPVAARDPQAADDGDKAHIATVQSEAGAIALFDAVHDPAFRRGLARALAEGAASESAGVRWIAEAVEPFTPPAESTLGSAEQSNTSIVLGDEQILKVFRLIKAGVHPDVEVTEFLTNRAGFANTPKLRASMRIEADGETTVTGMVQDFLRGSTDAWSYALERGRAYFAAPAGRAGPTADDPPNDFVPEAKRLGAVTRAMHEALAGDDDDPAFAPEPIEPQDLDRWAHRTQQSIRESLTLLEHQVGSSHFPKDRLAEAQALIRRKEHFLGWINEIDDTLDGDVGMRIRVHGDYHLGQVLHTTSGEFMIIDFEGEPSRSLDERREKSSPLRDVAGMLRSFAYAAATLATSAGKHLDPATREVRVGRWERDVRAAFLAGYLATQDEDAPEILPEDEQHVRQLIALFETEKAFYELSYELNNRPDWAWIPMRGISKLFVATR
jgi:maltose alpha-D-glucosyltransferase/alpha-amylase